LNVKDKLANEYKGRVPDDCEEVLAMAKNAKLPNGVFCVVTPRDAALPFMLYKYISARNIDDDNSEEAVVLVIEYWDAQGRRVIHESHESHGLQRASELSTEFPHRKITFWR
jgi:hypothetical protein